MVAVDIPPPFVRLYILKTTGALVQGPGNLNPAGGNFRLKLATQEPLEVQYLNAAAAPELLPTGQQPYLGVKVLGKYDDVFVAVSAALTAPTDAAGFYTGPLNCNTTEFAAAIGDVAGSTSVEADAIPLMGEVIVVVDEEGNLSRSQTFPITGANRVFTGSEGVPSSASPPYPPAAEVDTIAARNAAIAAAAFALRTVHTNDDKLYLTGLTGGEVYVITGEGNRIEQFLPAVSQMVVAGGSQDGVYARDANGNYASTSESDDDCINLHGNGGDGKHWCFRTGDAGDLTYYSTQDVPTPDLVTTWLNAGDDSPAATTVTRHDEANEANWKIIGNNTVNLSVYNTDSDCTINGIDCPAGVTTNVGWVDPLALVMASASGAVYPTSLTYGSSGFTTISFSVNESILYTELPYAFVYALPVPLPPRQSDVVLTFD